MNQKRISLGIAYKGKCSTFGGPQDKGMTPTEGVAYYQPGDDDPLRLFLDGGAGVGRKLNPDALYCACRFPAEPRASILRSHTIVTVTNPKNGKQVICRPADWGPAEWTGRIIDLSPGAAAALGVRTDDEVEIAWAILMPEKAQKSA